MDYWDYKAGVRKERGRKRSLRARGWDYSSQGAYFITTVVRDRESLFGEIREGAMELNDLGNIVDETWRELPTRYASLAINEFVVMPDHFHGILILPHPPLGAGKPRPYDLDPISRDLTDVVDRYTVGDVMGYFKFQSARRINEIRNTPGARVWQRNYNDRIIRSEKDLERTREYIRDNPKERHRTS